MATGRAFRGEDSYVAERITRSMVEPFLRQKGYRDIEDIRVRYGTNESQMVSAVDQNGQLVKLHVQSCWRRDRGNEHERLYSAAQLMAGIKNGDWEGSIRDKVKRIKQKGVTHSLLVQREGTGFIYAARVPLDAIWPIWAKQRAVSQSLIDRGVLRRQKKNHAANGVSPTMWLQDDRNPEAHNVADVLWEYDGVSDLVKLPDVALVDDTASDDTFDDLPMDHGQLGADGAPRVPVVRSMVKRDRRVRTEVLRRAEGACERTGCKETRDWAGFLDVHHILGAEKSDRVWNCVALCPNCHREAHYSPEHDAINAALLEYASSFKQAEAA